MGLISKKIVNSVIVQILMAMLLIAAMALASMSLSVYVTMDTQDDAEAINLAGSLRMQSYRIAHILSRAGSGEADQAAGQLQREAQEFSDKLFRSSIHKTVDQSGNTPLQKSYQKVVDNWHDKMEPLLTAPGSNMRAQDWRQAGLAYDQYLGEYVSDIDFMVTHLQRNTEGKIELLGVAEGMSIFLIIATMIFFIMKADSNFVLPLRALVHAAERVKTGDLAHRIDYAADNELGLLSQTFNDMTASLEQQYRTLEEQVTARTEQLHKSNQALYFLYKTSREIASTPYDKQLLKVFISDLKKVVEVDFINLCVNPEPNFTDYKLISTDKAIENLCFGDCDNCDMTPDSHQKPGIGDFSLPLKNRDDEFGFLHVRSQASVKLEPWQNQLLKTVAETLSTAFAFHHTLGQERRIILHEERSTIARELHDSLAQSLSYMKLEVARLKKMIDKGHDAQRIEEAITDLQEGLNAAYKHLRELLVTFRVKLDAPNLRTALEHAVEEFEDQSAATIDLEYSLGTYTMTPNQDIHILHILREALNNAVKHAQAKHISVGCTLDEKGDALFTVEDDGVGMPDNPEKQHHYGIYTMRERTQQLGGKLNYARQGCGGTRVELRLGATPGRRAAQA